MIRRKSLRLAWEKISRTYAKQIDEGKIAWIYSPTPLPADSDDGPEVEEISHHEADPDLAKPGFYRCRVAFQAEENGAITVDEIDCLHQPPKASAGDGFGAQIKGWEKLLQESNAAREAASRTATAYMQEVEKLHRENLRLQSELRQAKERVEKLENEDTHFAPHEIAAGMTIMQDMMANGGVVSEDGMRRAAAAYNMGQNDAREQH